jgi:magnesium-transporting ATPase (P-type)
MVPGDNPLTATLIAREAGVLDDNGLVVTGPEFHKKKLFAQMDAIALKFRPVRHQTIGSYFFAS